MIVLGIVIVGAVYYFLFMKNGTTGTVVGNAPSLKLPTSTPPVAVNNTPTNSGQITQAPPSPPEAPKVQMAPPTPPLIPSTGLDPTVN